MSILPLLARLKLPSFMHAQVRHMRPTLKINQEKFQITLDVRQFDKEELKVKAREEYVIIEGRQERQCKQGFVTRHFVRKFKLPKGCNSAKIQSTLTEDGTLTITVPRSVCNINIPCETAVPIKFVPCKDGQNDESLIKTIQSKKNPDGSDV